MICTNNVRTTLFISFCLDEHFSRKILFFYVETNPVFTWVSNYKGDVKRKRSGVKRKR